MKFISALLILVCLWPVQAGAQDYKTLLDIPDGSTLINFSVTERTEVDQDLLTAVLRVEYEDFERGAVQDYINSKMREAVDTARDVEDVKVSTQNYHVRSFDPNPRDGRRAEKWRGQQSLQLKSKNADAVLDLAGELQGMGLAMTTLSYSISPELYEETKNNMLEAALEKLQTKARRTAGALGKNNASLLQVNVDSGCTPVRPVMMARGMALDAAPESASAPVAAAGQSHITLNVSAQALISP